MNLNQVTIPAVDMDDSANFYRRMGFTQIVDTPHYARFECPDGESTFSLSLVESARAANFAVYFENENLDEVVQVLATAGFEFDQLPRDERYLWREAKLRDPAGNRIILYWAGENRKNPPWRVDKRA